MNDAGVEISAFYLAVEGNDAPADAVAPNNQRKWRRSGHFSTRRCERSFKALLGPAEPLTGVVAVRWVGESGEWIDDRQQKVSAK